MHMLTKKPRAQAKSARTRARPFGSDISEILPPERAGAIRKKIQKPSNRMSPDEEHALWRSKSGKKLLSSARRIETTSKSEKGSAGAICGFSEDERKIASRIIKSNERLVNGTALKYGRRRKPSGWLFAAMDVEDLSQEGYLSLLVKGLGKFEPDRGVVFSTYGIYWIKNFIRDALRRAMSRMNGRVDLYRKPAEDDYNYDPFARVPDCNPVSAEDSIATKEAKRVARALLDVLSPRERDVIEKRCGFNGREMSLQEIGREYGISRERIRQIEEKALSKMRSRAEDMGLEEAA